MQKNEQVQLQADIQTTKSTGTAKSCQYIYKHAKVAYLILVGMGKISRDLHIPVGIF